MVDLVTSMGKSLRLNWGSSFVSNINVVCNGAKAECVWPGHLRHQYDAAH